MSGQIAIHKLGVNVDFGRRIRRAATLNKKHNSKVKDLHQLASAQLMGELGIRRPNEGTKSHETQQLGWMTTHNSWTKTLTSCREVGFVCPQYFPKSIQRPESGEVSIGDPSLVHFDFGGKLHRVAVWSICRISGKRVNMSTKNPSERVEPVYL